jgi:hypothetical protein
MDYVDDMQMVCHIQWLDGTKILAVPQMLNFIENPDIASIPQTNKEYYDKCHYLDPSDLEHIVHPQALSSLQKEMMSHHCHLHHAPFPWLIFMAELGEIWKRLAQLQGHCSICVSCLFGTAHKRPCRTKSKDSHPICKESDMSPGARALVDQLVSAQPGLILQISGKLTHQRVNGSTIFVDHFSDHVYAYLMRDLTLDKKITAKHGFERFLHLLGIQSKAYHANNGCFTDQGLRDDYLQNDQVITFCGVGSHHQNGIAERKIKDLMLCARTMLLHTRRMLPEYISTIRWHFALKCAED